MRNTAVSKKANKAADKTKNNKQTAPNSVTKGKFQQATKRRVCPTRQNNAGRLGDAAEGQQGQGRTTVGRPIVVAMTPIESPQASEASKHEARKRHSMSTFGSG